MRALAISAILLSLIAIIFSGMIYYSNLHRDVYAVKSYKYFTDDEVHITVELPTGHLEKYNCAFPPNTDYANLKKVKIGKLKADYLLGGPVYYCNPAN